MLTNSKVHPISAVARSLLRGRKNEEQVTNYIYAPLNSLRNEIRILKIRPSLRLKDPIVCSLRVVSLEDVPRPKYAALSYCWGKGPADQPICCDGSTIWVTADLLDALRSLRKLANTCLWIDQISINQADLEERSSQVPLMKRIYPGAVKTYLHLGCRNEFPKWTMFYVMCRWVCMHIESLLLILADFLPLLSWLRLTQPVTRKYLKDDEYDSQQHVFAFRPCFARVWILQEISLSTEVEVICRNVTIRWDTLSKIIDGGLDYVAGMRRPPENYGLFLAFNDLIEVVKAQEENTFMSLLHESSFPNAFRASNPRDHLYTLLNLSSDAEDFPRPDYSIAVADVYQSFASALVAQGHGPNVLALASRGAKNQRNASWVPNWEEEFIVIDLETLSSFSAGRSGGHFVLRSDARVLSTNGIVVDTIFKAFPFNAERESNHGTTFEMLLELVSSTATAMQNDDEYAKSQLTWSSLADLHLILILCLVFDHDGSAFLSNAVNGGLYDVGALVANDLSAPKVSSITGNSAREAGGGMLAEILSYHLGMAYNENGSLLYSCLYTFARLGRFAVTATGSFCLTTSDVQVGDKIGVILGCRAPYVLREDGDGFLLIGEAYLQGLMHGEALDDTEHTVQEILIH